MSLTLFYLFVYLFIVIFIFSPLLHVKKFAQDCY